MLRSAVRSTRRAFSTHAQKQQLQLRHFSQNPAQVALRSSPKSASPLVAQAMLLDRFGKQHRFDYHHHLDGPSSQSLAYWTAALVASGVCIASNDSRAVHAASSKGSGSGSDKSASDLFEELKQKLQEVSGDALASIEKLVPDEYKDVQKQLNDFLASGKGGQISWGFGMGVCSGFALKKVSKVGAIALGTLFVLLQCASYSGYIDVNYKKLERDLMAFFDINKDGVFDSKDVDTMYQQVMKVLEFSLPAGSGYAVGFLIGFRAG